MVSQGQLYDLMEEHQDKSGVGEAAYLTARNLDQNEIATHLELRYRTSEPLEIFVGDLLEVTGEPVQKTSADSDGAHHLVDPIYR